MNDKNGRIMQYQLRMQLFSRIDLICTIIDWKLLSKDIADKKERERLGDIFQK